MKARITKRVVDSIKPDERDQFVWDAEAKGFGLKVTPKGRRIYVVQTRVGGRLRRYTIGRHGSPWTPEAARKEAIKFLGLVASGEDPSLMAGKARDNLSVSNLCELYLEEGCHTKKPQSRYNDKGNIRRHIKPLIGRLKLGNLRRGDIERMMTDIAAGKTAVDEKTGFRGRAIVRGGDIAANNAVTLLSSMLSFAVSRGLLAANPAMGTKKFRARARERFLTGSELSRLGAVLSKAEREGVNPTAVNAIRLLLLSGCRKNEILSLEWDWVDFDRSVLRLPDSKTGAKVVALGAPAFALLTSLKRDRDDSPYVLPSSKGSGHLVGLQKIWERLRARAGLEDVRLHDLRHTYASVGATAGESLYIVGKLVGHKQASTTQRYAHLADDPLRAAADRISSEIAGAMQAPTMSN